MRSEERGERILARTGAGINPPSVTKPAPGIEIKFPSHALKNRFTPPTDAKPAQIFDGGFDVFRPATVRVEILDTKDDPAVGRLRTLESGPKRGSMPEMEKSRGRRSDTSEILPAHTVRAAEFFGPSSASVRQLAKISWSSKNSWGSMAWPDFARTPLSAYSGWQSRQ